jgi:hypothetical protein
MRLFPRVSALLVRWADSSLKRELAQLSEQLEIERSKNRIKDAELRELAAVIARNIARVESETNAIGRE